MRILRFLCLAALVPAVLTVRAAEPPVIAKARAYLGSEETLNAVRSLHLKGSFLAVNTQDPASAKNPPSSVDIIFQKPFQHHLVVTSQSGVRTLALDGYDGWERDQPAPTAPPTTLRLLVPDQIRVLRADVWENLGYYRGLEDQGGEVEDQGPATIDGVQCEKIAFIHGRTIDGVANPAYYRYFDQSTGRLVYTVTSGGLEIREQGEISSGGIRFAQKIVSTRKAGEGSQIVTTLTVDSVTVNEDFPAGLFALPLPPIPSAASSAPAVPPANPVTPAPPPASP